MVISLHGYFIAWLFHCLFISLHGYFIAWLFHCMVISLPGYFIAWLFDVSCFIPSSGVLQNISRIIFLVVKYITDDADCLFSIHIELSAHRTTSEQTALS
jgi:hypothetical protein